MDETRIKFGSYLYEMNFFINLSDKNLNMLDNPYFEIKPYIMDNNVTYNSRPPKKDELNLIQCP